MLESFIEDVLWGLITLTSKIQIHFENLWKNSQNGDVEIDFLKTYSIDWFGEQQVGIIIFNFEFCISWLHS